MMRIHYQYLPIIIISSPQTRSIGIGKSRLFRWICQSNGSICGVLIILSLIGCVHSRKPVAEVPVAPARATDNYVYNDEKTGEVAGACSLAILKPMNPDDEFSKEQLGLRNLVRVINNTTKIKAKIERAVPATAITTNSPFLLVKPSDTLRTAPVLNQLEKYVDKGGFVMIDGSWGGRIIKKGVRTRVGGGDELLLFPFNLGKSSLRKLEAIVVDGRIAILITNRNYGRQWEMHGGRGRKSIDEVLAIKLGINAVVYALTHGKLSDASQFSIKKTPQIQSAPEILKKRSGGRPI